MNLQKMYQRIKNIVATVDTEDFIDCFRASCSELSALYGKDRKSLVFIENYALPDTVNMTNPLLDIYNEAVVDNILYLLTHEDNYKAEFLRKAQTAYLTTWNQNAKNRRIKKHL